MLKSKFEGLRQIWHFSNHWHLIVTRVLFPREPLLIYRLKDICFLEDHAAGDECGARSLLTTPMYRKLLQQMDLRGPLKVLDIGSSNGGFPLLLQACGLELEKVACVEMNPKTFMRMKWNVERNVQSIQFLRNAAVCGQSAPLTLTLASGNTGDSIYKATHRTHGRSYNIDGITFNELYETAFGQDIVDICKMDIEKAEYDVFDSEAHDAIRGCRYLLIEIHQPPANHSAEQLIAKLTKLGFVDIVNAKSDARPGVYGFRNVSIGRGAVKSAPQSH